MSNDTNRLLEYMYGELDEIEAERMEQALAHRPDLFDEWFAFHEAKHQLDAQPPASPDATVVDQIVGHARQAAASDAASAYEADAGTRGDGVPQRDAGGGGPVTVPTARRAAAHPASNRSAHEPTARSVATASQMRTEAAVPWALTLVLAAVLLLSGAPDAWGPGEPTPINTPVADLPAWDASNERAGLHRQATVLQARMSTPAGPLSSVSHSVTR